MVGIIWFGRRYQQQYQQLKTRAFDFSDGVSKFKDLGLIDPQKPSQECVPRELKRGWVTTIDRLGSGKFGEVWKGLIKDGINRDVPEYLVAVKLVIVQDSSGRDTTAKTAAAEEDLFNEALLMAQVESHTHLVSLVGVVTHGQPKMLVISFCEHGALDGMLQKRAADGEPFDPATKFRFCSEIAAGMSLLARHHFVHRDLATRNVLLASGMVCKVADFGMSRRVLTDDNASNYYRTTNDLIPVRWTAPEGLLPTGGKFSSASDVWSFGITCIEIIEDGQTPWFSIRSNVRVMAMVSAGQVHPRPAGCSELVYAVLKNCFAFAANARPTFSSLQRFFSERSDHVTISKLVEEGNVASHAAGRGPITAAITATNMDSRDTNHAGQTSLSDYAELDGSVSVDKDALTDAQHASDAKHAAQRKTAASLLNTVRTEGEEQTLAQLLVPNAAYASLTEAGSTTVATLPVAQPETTATSTPNIVLAVAQSLGTRCPIPDAQGSPSVARISSGQYAIPDSHVTHETPYGAVGRIDSSEQQLGRFVRSSAGAVPITGGGHLGTDESVAKPELTHGVHAARTKRTATPPTLLPYGSAKLLATPDVNVPALPPALPPARVPIATASTANLGDAGVESEQDRPPRRASSRSSLVNVKEGFYAIRPTVYEPVGKPHPMGNGIPGTAAPVVACSVNQPIRTGLHDAAGNAADQHTHAHVEFGHGTAIANAVGAGNHSTENACIATVDGPRSDNEPLSTVASSSGKFVCVSQVSQV